MWTRRTPNGMSRGWGLRLGVYFILLAAAVLLQSVALPLLFPHVRPDLVLLLVVMSALVRGSAQGSVVGMMGGLIMDFYSGRFIGMNMLTKGFVGLLLGWLELKFFKENVIVPTTLAVCAAFGEQMLYWILLSAFGWGPPFGYVFLRIMLPTAVFNGLLAYPMFLLVREVEKFLMEFQANP